MFLQDKTSCTVSFNTNEKYSHYMEHTSVPLEASYLPVAKMKENNYKTAIYDFVQTAGIGFRLLGNVQLQLPITPYIKRIS